MKFNTRQLVDLVATFDDGTVKHCTLPPHIPFEVPQQGKWYGVHKGKTFTVCHELEVSFYVEDGWERAGEFTYP